MQYSVSQAAEVLGLTPSTLRYYDREGLLPNLERSEGGIRIFSEGDIRWLRLISCLKATGMPLKDIRRYIQLTLDGDGTIPQRLALFHQQRQRLLEQMEQLRQTLEVVDYKCWFYETAQQLGTTDLPGHVMEQTMPESLRPVARRLHGQ